MLNYELLIIMLKQIEASTQLCNIMSEIPIQAIKNNAPLSSPRNFHQSGQLIINSFFNVVNDSLGKSFFHFLMINLW